MEKKARYELEDLVFAQLKVITDVTVARHLDIPNSEAHKLMEEFHKIYKEDNAIRAVYTVTGEMNRMETICGAVVLAKEDNLEEVKSTFVKVTGVNLFALHKDPIDDLTTILAYDTFEDEKFFRGDDERAGIKTLQIHRLREEMETKYKEECALQKAVLSGGHSTMATSNISSKTEVKKEIVAKEKIDQKNKLAALFQKACEREKTPKNSPKKLRESPFSSAEKKEPEDSPNPKRRARKIIIDSDEDIPVKKAKSPIKEEPPVEKKRKPSIKEELPEVKEENIDVKEKDQENKRKKEKKIFSDEDLYEAASPEKLQSSQKESPAKDKEKTTKKPKVNKAEKEEKSFEPLRRSPRKHAATNAAPGKKKVVRKELDTFVDDEGFLVTKEVLKEVEIDIEESPTPKPFSPKKTNQPPAPSKAKKATASTGQSKISTFFKK